MMGEHVALCVDESTVRNPVLIGLEDEALASQRWLDVYTTGGDARQAIAKSEALAEAWVISCEDVDAINLAAALKADNPELCVWLVSFDICGSLKSRAHTASIDRVVNRNGFISRYAEMKRRLSKPHATALHAAESPLRHVDVPFDGEGEEAPVPGRAPVGALASSEKANGVHAQHPNTPGEIGSTTGISPMQPPRLAHGSQARQAFFLPIVSGSGGSGKSSVAAMAALIAHKWGQRTLLVDLDLQFGDVASMLGVEKPLTIDVALTSPKSVTCSGDHAQAPLVLAPPGRLESSEAIARAMPRFLDMVRPGFDIVIANTGATWTDLHIALLEQASAALFVIDQRASSVRACKRALELCARCGIASGPFRFAVNRCSKAALLTSIDVACALQGVSAFELKDGGRDVEECLSSGAALELLSSHNDFCSSLELVMERLVPDVASARSGHASATHSPKSTGRQSGGIARIWERRRS